MQGIVIKKLPVCRHLCSNRFPSGKKFYKRGLQKAQVDPQRIAGQSQNLSRQFFRFTGIFDSFFSDRKARRIHEPSSAARN